MKSKSFLLALLTVIVFACSDPEIKDPAVGNWKHTVTAPLQVGWNLKPEGQRDPINPALITTFTITRTGAGYQVSNIKTTFGTNEISTTGTIEGVAGSVSALKFEGADFFINMSDVRFNEFTSAFANGVTFKNPGSATVYSNPGSAITRE